MSLTSDAKTWLANNGYNQTSSALCNTSAPFYPPSPDFPAPLHPAIKEVSHMCQQICDFCPPTKSTSTSTEINTSTF